MTFSEIFWGNHRDALMAALEKLGYAAKRSGG
jgi:hypothetical protein